MKKHVDVVGSAVEVETEIGFYLVSPWRCEDIGFYLVPPLQRYRRGGAKISDFTWYRRGGAKISDFAWYRHGGAKISGFAWYRRGGAWKQKWDFTWYPRECATDFISLQANRFQSDEIQ